MVGIRSTSSVFLAANDPSKRFAFLRPSATSTHRCPANARVVNDSKNNFNTFLQKKSPAWTSSHTRKQGALATRTTTHHARCIRVLHSRILFLQPVAKQLGTATATAKQIAQCRSRTSFGPNQKCTQAIKRARTQIRSALNFSRNSSLAVSTDTLRSPLHSTHLVCRRLHHLVVPRFVLAR
jgi:hypothetical protein